MNEENWPTVALIIPVYNEESALPENLASVLQLDYPAGLLNIIYVDNNSTDGSRALLEQASEKVTILDEPAPGAGAARNRGIRHCQSEIVAFTDADCRVHPGWLKALVAPLFGRAGTLATGGRISARPGSNFIGSFGDVIHDHRNAIERCVPPYLVTMNLAVSRRNLVDVGLFDEDLLRGQDSDLAFRLGLNGVRFEYVDEAIVWHRNQETLRGLFAEGFKHGKWNVRVIEKHRDTLFRDRPIAHAERAPRVFPLFQALIKQSIQSGRLARNELCRLVFNSGKNLGMRRGASLLARER